MLAVIEPTTKGAESNHSSNSMRSSCSCPYCDHVILSAAPTTEQQDPLLKNISPGTRLDIWCPKTEAWLGGIVIAYLDNGLWQVKPTDKSSNDDPAIYHLMHYKVKNIRLSDVAFPLRASWKGAVFDSSIVSKNDLICIVSCGTSSYPEQIAVWGTICVGLDGPIFNFMNVLETIDNERAAKRAILAGLGMIMKIIQEQQLRADIIWIVSDSKAALEQIWGCSGVRVSSGLFAAAR